MLNATALWKPIEAWAEQHRRLLGALGHALAFAVLFGGVALAAYTSDFADTAEAIVCGAAAIVFVRLYVRAIPAAQRLIDTLHPEPDAAKPAALPNWALAIYALIGLALILLIIAQEETYTYAAMELFVGWAAGRHALDYVWTRRTNPQSPKAFDIIDTWLDAQAERHGPLLRTLGTALAFAALSGGVALHAYESGFARAAAAACGPVCSGIGVAAAATLCGAAAVVFTWLYAGLTLAAQRTFIDPWAHVRPEPPSRKLARWAWYLYLPLGLAFFIVTASIGGEHASGNFSMNIETAGGFRASLGPCGVLGLFLGWGAGGRGVLAWFWSKARERAETRARA